MFTYRFRAEGMADVANFLVLPNVGQGFHIEFFDLAVPIDVLVTFASFKTLGQLKAMISELPDSHVMIETIATLDKYTGER